MNSSLLHQADSLRPPVRRIAAVMVILFAIGWLGSSPGLAQPAGENRPEPVAADDPATPNTSNSDKQPVRSAVPTSPREVLEAVSLYFIVPFLMASVIAVWFAVERLVVLRRGRVIPRPFVARFLDHLRQGKLDPERALKLCEDNGSPVAAVFAHGVRKWGKPSVEVEQAIIDGGERQVSLLRKHLRILNGVATVTPLVGLLGTVIGMIQAFNEVATHSAQGKAEELAAGIALALLTTAIGLLIAIPSLIVYMYLAGRVDALVMIMDDMAQNVVHLISAEGLTESPVPAAHSRPAAAAPKKRAV